MVEIILLILIMALFGGLSQGLSVGEALLFAFAVLLVVGLFVEWFMGSRQKRLEKKYKEHK